MGMIERIEEISQSAQEAVASADDLSSLEAVRVQFLGRKAELTGILRGSPNSMPISVGRSEDSRTKSANRPRS